MCHMKKNYSPFFAFSRTTTSDWDKIFFLADKSNDFININLPLTKWKCQC